MQIAEGKVKDMMIEFADCSDARPVDDEQAGLTDEFLLPSMAAIKAELFEMRTLFDERYMAVLAKTMRNFPDINDPSLRNPKTYPIGFCNTIRDGVWEDMLKKLRYPEDPGMRALSHFSGQGGHLKKISGIQHSRFFQNAIQAGALFVDVANDTVDRKKPSVAISDFVTSGFTNISGFVDSAEVIETYWGYKIFPQRVFPFLAPFCPMMTLSKTGTLQMLPTTKSMVAKNVFSDFRLAEDFIFKSPFAGAELVRKYHEKMGEHFAWDEDTWDFECGVLHADVFYRGGAPDEVLLDIFTRLRNMDCEYLPGFIEDTTNVINAFNEMRIKL